MIDKNCYYHCSGECLKGLPRTECKVEGCVARTCSPLFVPAIEEKRLLLTASNLVDAVERYVKQACLRSELLLKKEDLKKCLETKTKMQNGI